MMVLEEAQKGLLFKVFGIPGGTLDVCKRFLMIE